MKNNLLKKLIAPLVVAGAVSLTALVGCSDLLGSIVPPTPSIPTKQILKINLTYSGTARTFSPYEKHDIRLSLQKDGLGYYPQILPANPSDLGRGYNYQYGVLDPGNYDLYVSWDWDNDGVTPGNTEPKGQPYPLHFTMDGLSTKTVNLPIIDQTNPTDPGRVEGIIDYNGHSMNSYPLYVVIEDLYYNIISTQLVNGERTNGGRWYYTNSTGKLLYSIEIPVGGPYQAVTYLDVNGNERGDGQDIRSNFYLGDYGIAFDVSPGLATAGINMGLLR